MTEFNGEIASDSIAARIGRTTNGWRVDSYAEQSDSLFATSIQQKKKMPCGRSISGTMGLCVSSGHVFDWWNLQIDPFFLLYRILFDFVKMNESIVSHRMYITLIGQKCTIGKYGGQLKQFDHCYRVHINGFHSFWRSWTWLTEWPDSFGYTLFKEDFEKAF